jgi:hypothetical protein
VAAIGERDLHGETRRNDTHASTTDHEARLYRKSKAKEAKLSYIGNALTENRHGLVVEAELGSATGTIEREGAARRDSRGRAALVLCFYQFGNDVAHLFARLPA